MDDGDGLPVTDGNSLIDFWERHEKNTPELVKNILLSKGDRKLKSKWYTKYFIDREKVALFDVFV